MNLRVMLIGAHTLVNLEVLTQHLMVIRELTGQMARLNTIMTMMTMEGQINIRMILMGAIITIGKTVLEVRRTASDGSPLQELHWWLFV